MTYTEAIAWRDAIETTLLSGSGKRSVTIADRTIVYENMNDMRDMLDKLNAQIKEFDRRTVNKNPYWRTPRWQ